MSTKPEKRDVNLIDKAIDEMAIINNKEKVLTNFNFKLVKLEAYMLSSFYDKNKDKLQGSGMPDLSDSMPKSTEKRVHQTLSNFMIPVPKGFKPPNADTSSLDTENVRDRVQASTAWLVETKNDPNKTKYPDRELSTGSVVQMQDLSYKLSEGIKKNVERINDYSKGNIKGNMVNVKDMQERLDKGENVDFKSTQFLIKRFAINKETKQMESQYSVMVQGNDKSYTSVSAIKDEPSFILMKGTDSKNGNPTSASQIIMITEDLHNKKIVNGDSMDKTKHPLDPVEASIYLSTLDDNHYMDDPDVSVLLVDSRHLKSVVNDIKDVNPKAAIRFAFKSDNTPVAKPTKENGYKFEAMDGGVLKTGFDEIKKTTHDEKQYNATGFAVIPVSSDSSLKDLSKTFFDKAKESFPDDANKQESVYKDLMSLTGDKTKALGDDCKKKLVEAYEGVSNAPYLDDLSFKSRASNLEKYPGGKPEPEPEPQQQLGL